MAAEDCILPSAKKKLGRPKVDYTGRKIGSRLVIGRAQSTHNLRPRWHVRCDCGHEFTCLTQSLSKQTTCKKCAHKGPRPYRRKRPYEASYNNFVGRAKYAVSITYEQFAELAKITECHYCGAHISWQKFRHSCKGGSGSNLDRIDNTKPYAIENVVVCCRRCNYGKNTFFSYDEWLQIGALIRSWSAAKV